MGLTPAQANTRQEIRTWAHGSRMEHVCVSLPHRKQGAAPEAERGRARFIQISERHVLSFKPETTLEELPKKK